MMKRKLVGALFVVLVLDVVVIGVSVHSAGWCPSLCVCDTWYGLQHASCTSRHLYSIHTGAPNTVQALDLSNNSISLLNNYELMEAGLSQLRYLNLSANTISEIGLNAFSGLTELSVLDLSHNHLYYLLSGVFVSTTNLRLLRLSRNNFDSHIPKLECPWLTDLRLDSCHISHVPADTFTGLSYLRNLDLSNNLMIQLDSVALDAVQFLRKLSLQGNPWSCDKLTYNLQMYLIHRNIQYQAICAKNPEPKKFEKMIAYNPRTKYEKPNRPSLKFDTKNIVVRKNVVATSVRESKKTNEDIARNVTDTGSFARTLNAMSPYWFLAIGFVLGSACGMFMCYLWLTRKISRCCRAGYRARRTNDIQRVSLLQNLWQLPEDSALDESGTASCPDTPPPPYREVMLRPGLYRNPLTTTNLNSNFNNVAASGAGYT